MNEGKKTPIWLYPACILAVALIAVIVAVCLNTANPTSEPLIEASAPSSTPAPDIPPASEENNLLTIATKAQGSEEKICYLTFDDGPTREVTPLVLDILKAQDVKATFFVLGQMAENNRDLAKRVYDEGHLLANHSYSHDYKSLYATGESFMAEIEKTHALIREICGTEPFKLIRFPGGGYNAGSYAAEKQQYKLLLQQNGYYYADWNALNGDAEGGNRSAEQLLNRIKQTSGPKNLVVLMHDAATKKTTADSLPAVITYLKDQGYIFKRLDEIPYYGEETEKPVVDMVL